MKTLLTIILLPLVLLAGCNGKPDVDLPEHIRDLENLTVYPADTEPAYAIDLVPVQTFGDSDSILINTIMGATVDDRDRVLIWERTGTSFKLHAFNPDGTYHSQIGRSGQGPGEYQFISSLQVKSGNIYTYDPQTSRVNRYNLEDFTYLDSFVPQQWAAMEHEAVRDMSFSDIHVRNDGNFLVSFMESYSPDNTTVYSKYLIVSPDGTVINDAIPELPSDQMFTHREGNFGVSLPLPFMGQTLYTLTNDDQLLTAWSNDFLIKKFDENGRYQSAFYYPVQGVPFDADKYFEVFSSMPNFDMRKAVESAIEIPAIWPVLGQFHLDDENRSWAGRIVENQDVYEWWILDESGELLGRFNWPRDKRLMAIKNSHFYTREVDEETSLQTIEKYRIELSEN